MRPEVFPADCKVDCSLYIWAMAKIPNSNAKSAGAINASSTAVVAPMFFRKRAASLRPAPHLSANTDRLARGRGKRKQKAGKRRRRRDGFEGLVRAAAAAGRAACHRCAGAGA